MTLSLRSLMICTNRYYILQMQIPAITLIGRYGQKLKYSSIFNPSPLILLTTSQEWRSDGEFVTLRTSVF